jgi:hypothetical protein
MPRPRTLQAMASQHQEHNNIHMNFSYKGTVKI